MRIHNVKYGRFFSLVAAMWLLVLFNGGMAAGKSDDPYRAPDVVREIHHVRDLLFNGQYEEVGPATRIAQEKYPGLLVWHFAAMLAPQARMLEMHNWGLSSDYYEEWEKLLELSGKIEGNRPHSAYDYLCLGGGYGIVGLHHARARDFRRAFTVALKALGNLNKTLETDPECWDAYLGYGIYHYFRGVLAERFKWLPLFSNDREKGLEELDIARTGIFAEPLADMALVYLYKEEGKWEEGLAIAQKLRKQYPRGYLIPQLIGFFQMRLDRHKEAMPKFDLVLEHDPENGPVHLFRGISLYYLGRIEESERECEICIRLKPTSEYLAVANFFLGEIAWKRGQYETARAFWKKAYKLETKNPEISEALKRPVPGRSE